MSDAGIAKARVQLGEMSTFISSRVLAANMTNQSLETLLEESIVRIEGPTIPPVPGAGATLTGVGRPPRFTELDKVEKIRQDMTQLANMVESDPTFLVSDDQLRSNVTKIPVRDKRA
jgi:hypothetical protein